MRNYKSEKNRWLSNSYSKWRSEIVIILVIVFNRFSIGSYHVLPSRDERAMTSSGHRCLIKLVNKNNENKLILLFIEVLNKFYKLKFFKTNLP